MTAGELRADILERVSPFHETVFPERAFTAGNLTRQPVFREADRVDTCEADRIPSMVVS